jgi:hypothetical protein
MIRRFSFKVFIKMIKKCFQFHVRIEHFWNILLLFLIFRYPPNTICSETAAILLVFHLHLTIPLFQNIKKPGAAYSRLLAPGLFSKNFPPPPGGTNKGGLPPLPPVKWLNG